MLAVLLRHLPQKSKVTMAMPSPVPAPTLAPGPAPTAPTAPTAPAPAATPAVAVRLVAPAAPDGDAGVFNVDKLMGVMGKDAKGRAVMLKMVRGAVDGGMAQVDEAGKALEEGRLRDAARQFHSLRGAVGVLGARRLIQATIDAEDAIIGARDEDIAARYHAVRIELEATLDQARAWLGRQPD